MDKVRGALRLDESEADGSGVTIAVIDTGVDLDHPDVGETVQVDQSRSVLMFDSRLVDPNGHGTHIIGLIAGSGELWEEKYRGVAPAAQIIALRAFGAAGLADSSAVVEAVQVAVDLGVDIINYSAGEHAWMKAGGGPPWRWPKIRSAKEDAFVAAAHGGLLCVCAAGNSGPNEASVESPGILPEVLGVGAIGRDGAIAPGSSRGPVYRDPSLDPGQVQRESLPSDLTPEPIVKPDLAVPGGDVPKTPLDLDAKLTIGLDSGGIIGPRSLGGVWRPLVATDVGSRYTQISGTSQATAIASGLAALALDYATRVGMDWGGNQGSSSLLMPSKTTFGETIGTRGPGGHQIAIGSR